MVLGRREPHPAKAQNELLTFNCLQCRTQEQFEMDVAGVLMPSN
jgi:hypothetical protein